MRCAEFRAMAESYVAGELPVDTNHEVIAHLERCPDCRSELDARVALRQTLRRAFEQTATLAPAPEFVTGLRAALTVEAPHTRSRFALSNTWLALAAGIVLVVIVGWQFRSIDRLPDASSHLAALASHAAGDHRECALEHALAVAPISLEEAARRYNAAYAGLRQIVDQSEPVRTGDIEVIAAHWCVLDGRPFAHVVVRRAGHVVSLLLTPVDQREVRPAEGAQTEAAMCPAAGGFNVACFDVRGHAGFVVSDLTGVENLSLARALAPALQAYLGRA